MVPVRIHRIAPIGELRPQCFCEIFVVRHGRPLRVSPGVQRVFAHDFLQAHDLGADLANGVTQRGKNEAPLEQVKAHVGIEGQNIDQRMSVAWG